ncbi:uncharacterized protein LOC115879108 [Sitophilus oryzae]|uniref:Uncharacterized protein LOC115879108 n=1 Tax=Sitophilus oryzae TaxID=7048 RepID=A0A6J2XLR8_SITOR|nr:uncharacterized protein LOC115879108 [Sitophilus oryzae]
MPLRPITSSRDSATSNLSRFLLQIVQPLVEETSSFVKNSKHFVDILKKVELGPSDKFVSFEVDNLYTNVSLEESLDIVEARLRDEVTFSERTSLPLGGVMELFRCCLRNSYFQVKEKFYAQNDGLPMGSPLSPVLANIYMEWFETNAISIAVVKHKIWLRYVDDAIIIWNGIDRQLDSFLNHLNSRNISIRFTIEKEKNFYLPFLDVLVSRSDGSISPHFCI